MSHRDTIIHLVAGGVAGTAGAIATCPFEVVKTRLQSSTANFHNVQKVCVPPIASSDGNGKITCKTIPHGQRSRFSTCTGCHSTQVLTFSSGQELRGDKTMGLLHCIRYIVENEGPKALFKGLGPNLVGVAPSRAMYFCAYSQSKSFFNSILNPDTAIVHICAASCAGFVASTATNPIWFVKTRLQLDMQRNGKRMTAAQCVKRIYRQSGIRGFYKGITASYFGISETVIHFVIYEALKAKLIAAHSSPHSDTKSTRDFLEFMFAGAVSKTVASCIAYPHEVARTRLREEGNKYHHFWQTLATVFQEEGHRGLYRGLATQLIRQIPNTAIVMSTYEAVVYVLTRYFGTRESVFYEEGLVTDNLEIED